MNKQLAKTGTTLSKNMTNTEALSLTTCTSNYIKTNEITCAALDIPTSLPTTKYAGTMYFDTTNHELYIYNGNDWNYITLTVV